MLVESVAILMFQNVSVPQMLKPAHQMRVSALSASLYRSLENIRLHKLLLNVTGQV